jgi:hypothetical protein
MSFIQKFTETITITSTANTTAYIPATGFINGELHNIFQHPGSSAPTSNTDVTMVVESTSQTVLQTVNLSTGAQVFAPFQVVTSTTGGTTAASHIPFVMSNERLKVNIVDATTGNTVTFSVFVK